MAEELGLAELPVLIHIPRTHDIHRTNIASRHHLLHEHEQRVHVPHEGVERGPRRGEQAHVVRELQATVKRMLLAPDEFVELIEANARSAAVSDGLEDVVEQLLRTLEAKERAHRLRELHVVDDVLGRGVVVEELHEVDGLPAVLEQDLAQLVQHSRHVPTLDLINGRLEAPVRLQLDADVSRPQERRQERLRLHVDFSCAGL